MHPISKLRALLTAVALIVALSPALAQEDTRPPAEQAPGGDAGRAAEDNEDEGDDVFIPTEEIPADEEITFPVDI